MTHYELLGVDPAAPVAEIRAAYVAEARAHHPDAVGPTGGDAATRRMAELNAAWAVLSDPAARAAYDAAIGVGPTAPGLRLDPVVHGFRPLDPDDDADEGADDWRFEPDVYDPTTAPGRVALGIPLGLVALAVAAFGCWIILDHPAFGVVGLVASVLAGVAFVMAPMVAMAKASAGERRD